MSLQGTFNTAVQAMNSQSQFMSNISTNIANVNTTAFKTQDTHFATLLNHSRPTNKSFFTVNTFDYRQVDKQGSITTTNRTFDVAINGRGFFVTNTQADGSGIYQYTRDGAFFGKAVALPTDTDADGVLDQGTLLTTSNGNFVLGWPADGNGAIAETSDLTALTPVVFSNNSIFPSQATTAISLQANVSATDDSRQTVGLPFVDQEGNSRTLTLGFTGQLGNNWTLDMSAVDTNNQPVAVTFDPQNLTFDGKGQLASPSDGLLTVEITDINGPQSFIVNLKKMTSFSDGKKLTVVNVDQDGFIAGRLDKTYFTGDGVLVGSYTNGEVRSLYKLPIANFAANNNLEAKSGNMFEQSFESGALQLNGLGTPTGTTQIVTGALEQSNVDLADQFSKMIITQRAYSSSAKVLTTADEMTQAVRDLKR